MSHVQDDTRTDVFRATEEALLTAFLRDISAVNYLILRNYCGLPTTAGNDVDVLVDHNQLATTERALRRSAQATGYILINRAEFSPVSLFVSHDVSRHQLHVDLFTGLKWRGLDILGPDSVLSARQNHGPFFVPHPVHEASINLLTRLLYHGYVSDKYKPGILAAYRAEPDKARNALTEPFGTSAAGELVAHVLSENWVAIEAATNRWRRLLILRSLTRSPLHTLSSLLSDAGRLIRRIAVPPGLMLVLLGPDGSGKSSVAAGVMNVLGPSFGKERSRYLHWKPELIRRRRSDSGPTTDPHGRPPRGVLSSLVHFTFHLLEFVVGGQLKIRPVLIRNGLVAVDRYYYDFLVDPKRYRLNVPGRLVRWASRAVMRPDLVICLDAPTEVLQGRKWELPPEETGRQRKAYVNLARTLPNAHVVDASRPLDEVVSVVTGIALDYLASRAARRLGLDES